MLRFRFLVKIPDSLDDILVDNDTEADEFAGMIPADDGRKTPTRAEVDDLFAALEDPERRIAYKLFWFWPTETDPATAAKSKRDPNAAYRYTDTIMSWKIHAMSVQSHESVIERHNLAVYSHLMALYGEQSPRQRTEQQVPADVDNHWRDGIRWWNDLAGDPDLWHSVSEFVTALNDPRLDYRFARSLRDQFAYAFDQINVELAIEFAKTGREADAKRQVAYMKLSQPGSDDVEGTFDDAFSGLLKQTEAIVDAALAEAKAKPKDGLKQANAVLNQTADPLRVSRIVLDKGSPVRDAIVSAVFAGVRGCLIAYGNETKDWDECLKIAEELKGVAETKEQKEKAEEDSRIIANNMRAADMVGRCACCGAKIYPSDKEFAKSVPLYGQVEKGLSYGQVKYKTQTIVVPICKSCAASSHTVYNSVIRRFPVIKNLLDQGWKIGQRPTQEEIRALWTQRTYIPRPQTTYSPTTVTSKPSVTTETKKQKSKSLGGFLFSAIKLIGAGIILLFCKAPLLFIIGCVFLYAWIDGGFRSDTVKSSPPKPTVTRNIESEELWKSRREQQPYNGAIRRYHYASADAPLGISTSSGENYYVKLVRPSSGETVVDVFIVGGNTVEIDVPSGTYELRYASGRTWYGYHYLFGPNTAYSKANRLFSFTYGRGYDVTLYKVANGNLSTQRMSEEDF